jgi:hypothetical protein
MEIVLDRSQCGRIVWGLPPYVKHTSPTFQENIAPDLMLLFGLYGRLALLQNEALEKEFHYLLMALVVKADLMLTKAGV